MLTDNAVLVTGAAGFIGSNLCERLLEICSLVIGLDNLQTGRMANIRSLLQRSTFEFVQGDLRDLDLTSRLIQKKQVGVVFHQAALPSVPRSIEAPISTHQANVDGTLNLLIAAKGSGVKRVVYASSSSVYGVSEQLPKIETMLTQPISPYAVSKLAGEMYCKAFTASYGLETVALRYFNVFGPRQANNQYSGVISIFIGGLLGNKSYQIFGDGEQSRDFTFIENVVEANISAAQASDVSGENFNIACGQRTSINTLEATLAQICGCEDRKISYAPPRSGDVRHSLADITKARELLGYVPSVNLQEGLEKTVAWFREHPEEYQ